MARAKCSNFAFAIYLYFDTMKEDKIVLHRLSRVRRTCCNDADSVKRSKMLTCGDDRTRAMLILQEAQNYYNAMYTFRKDRDRNKRYNYSDQWCDTVCVDGVRMTEEEYIRKQGNPPLKVNLIRRLVRNVVGVYRSQATEPTCIARDRDEQQQAETMSTVLQYNQQLNRMSSVNSRSLEEFLISGLIVHRKWYGWRNDSLDCWTDYVQPNNFFIDNSMRDFRGWDCSFIGEIHDIDFGDLCQRFADTPESYLRLSEIYRHARDREYTVHVWESFGYNSNNMTDFLVPTDYSKCRVIEVWRKESKPRYRCHDYNNGEVFKCEVEDYGQVVESENLKRLEMAKSNGIPYDEVPFIKSEWFMDSYWYYYYLSPLGDILKEGETPYAHRMHPYVFKAYPFIDGEIHSFVGDVVDVQRYANHLIIMEDWIRRAGAKGLLMIPEDTLGDTSPEEFADSWHKFNGVIVYKPSKTGNKPEQIYSRSTNVGSSEMLSLMLSFFEEISGVNGALQGKPGYSGMSAALYNQQTLNATVSLLDILDSFNEFTTDAAYKDVKNIQQYYDQVRVVNISGKAGSKVVYDPKKIRDVEFDLSIVPSQSTPTYRAVSNDFLMQLLNFGAISVEQLLECGDFPFADRLLQSIQRQKEQVQQGQVPDDISHELMQQVNSRANPDAISMLQQARPGIRRRI